jgi:catechol 2,3-dioxygenase-like lactoylglutathione lyase family enzyme
MFSPPPRAGDFTVAVLRVVANIATEQMDAAKAFYGEVLGMTVAMDHGWILTFIGSGQASPQISFAAEGGSGTQVPDLSIEVDDLAGVYQRVADAGYRTEYGPVTEPWGVRRFFVRDPFGRLLNILAHTQ